MIKTVKKQTMFDSSSSTSSLPSYIKGSFQSNSRIRRRTILGEKFDYGEKIKEKQNYVLYVAGQGQEKKEIEEIEELPSTGEKKERIIEQKELIDNYQYHETKDIKKKHSRNSQTQHKRLCDPFERTKVKKYSSYTSEPRKGGYKIIRTTNIVDKNDYSMDYFHNNNKNNIKTNLSSLTSKTQRGQYSRRVESYSNMSHTSSNNESYQSQNRTNNIVQINNRNRRQISNERKINDFSQYERKKINGMVKSENYSINRENKKENLIPQNAIKYKYDKDKDKIPKNQNNTYNRIPIDISKYSSNQRKNSATNRVQNNHSIKLDININKEKSLHEGPKYQLLGKDLPKDKQRPKTVSRSRMRSNRVNSQQRISRQIYNENKGYIPFGGKGTRVGGAPVNIPRPINNRNKIPKPGEERYSSIKIERNSNNTESSQRSITSNENIFKISNNNSNSNSNNNIRGMRDLREDKENSNPNVRRNININTNKYQKTHKNIVKIKNPNENKNKFPGRGIRVGSSGINRSELISETNNTISYSQYKKFEKENMDTLEVSGKKNEIIKCFEQSLFYQGEQQPQNERKNENFNENENQFEENIGSNEENEGMFKVIFCPVHGKQVIRICDYNN